VSCSHWPHPAAHFRSTQLLEPPPDDNSVENLTQKPPHFSMFGVLSQNTTDHTPGIPHSGPGQEDCEFQARLGLHSETLSQTQNKKNNN
jgi:hypothetical protein